MILQSLAALHTAAVQRMRRTEVGFLLADREQAPDLTQRGQDLALLLDHLATDQIKEP